MKIHIFTKNILKISISSSSSPVLSKIKLIMVTNSLNSQTKRTNKNQKMNYLHLPASNLSMI